MQRADIITTRHFVSERHAYDTYAWDGQRHWPVSIPDWIMRDASFPWPLVRVGDDVRMAGGVYVRTDAWSWPLTAVRVWLHPLTQSLKARVIWTAMIWGLASVPHGALPRWRDIGKRSTR